MVAMASQIFGVTIVYSTICSGGYQRKHQSSASLAFCEGGEGNPPVTGEFPSQRPMTRNFEAETKWTTFRRRHFQTYFLQWNIWISLKISLEFVPKVPINNIPALVLIMAWRQPGDKPLSDPVMVSLPTHICVTRPQWVNILFPQVINCSYEYSGTPL